MIPTSRSFRVVYVLVFLLLGLSFAFSQTQNGAILGSIYDPSGAIVPGVKVVAQNQLTKAQRTVQSGSDGAYQFAVLPAGTYTITALARGFEQYVDRDLTLSTGQVLRVNIKLALGGASQEVTVKSKVSVIEADTATITSAVNQ